MEEVRKMLQLTIATLKETDDAALFAAFSQTYNPSDGSCQVPNRQVIADATSLPRFSSKLSQFFPQCKPYNYETHTKCQFLHTNNLSEIIDDLKKELANYDLAIYKKSLQHWDTSFA